MSFGLIFVAGVHGAGKTTVCRNAAEFLGIPFVSAGSLIRQAAAGRPVEDQGAQKVVLDVTDNQALLLEGLASWRAEGDKGAVLLDGHFSLISSSSGVVTIPLRVFQSIGASAMFLLDVEPHLAHRRLLRRDGSAPALALLESLVINERRHANWVTERLGIPLRVLSAHATPDDVSRNLASHIRGLMS